MGRICPNEPCVGQVEGVFEEKSFMIELLYFNLSLYFLFVLGAFPKLRKATISFVVSVRPSVRPSVCLSVRTEQLGSHWTDFDKIGYLSIFRKSVQKIQVS